MIQEQFQAKLNVWRRTAKTFLRSSSCYTSVSGMLQHESKNSKTMGLSDGFWKRLHRLSSRYALTWVRKWQNYGAFPHLQQNCLFRQIFCHHQHFTSADGFWNDLRLIASDVERPNDLAVVSIASASLLKTASIKSNDLTLKLPRVVSFLIFYILGSKNVF